MMVKHTGVKIHQRAKAELSEDEWGHVKLLAIHLNNKASDGVPYSNIAICDEISAYSGGWQPMAVIAATLEKLVKRHNWRFNPWGVFVRGRADVSLRAVLDGATPNGVPYTVSQIEEWVKVLTGEDVTTANLRRSLGRLVEQGRFERTDSGIYRRIHRGM